MEVKRVVRAMLDLGYKSLYRNYIHYFLPLIKKVTAEEVLLLCMVLFSAEVAPRLF